ncbi:hypothetical protein QCA50_005611 [Cerrena zonata]|uniref:BTB domain-containing protein n=1 Tax=Cerrena zonata TaxID=2478898 RepID=A0AAW0GJU5_9APHY
MPQSMTNKERAAQLRVLIGDIKQNQQDFNAATRSFGAGIHDLLCTLEAQASADDQYRRPNSIWYNDGSVILVAQGTGFKVHQSVLSQHSTVFLDLIETASLRWSSLGTLVVMVSDYVDDLSIFLKVLYNPGNDSYFKMPNTPAPIEWVSALIKLGKKYQVKFIFDEAVSRLKSVHPRTYAEYKLMRGAMSNHISDYPNGEMAITIINLARAHNLPNLLPFAFYLCCQLPLETIMHGVKRNDGTAEKLSSDDIMRCLKGREQLTLMNASLVQTLRSYMPSMNKCNAHKCDSRWVSVVCGDSPLSPKLMGYNFRDWEIGFCKRCKKAYRRIVEDAREKTFPMFSDIFELN